MRLPDWTSHRHGLQRILDRLLLQRSSPRITGPRPALRFLNDAPATVAAELMATIDAVAAGPPPSFRGGGRYRTMHGSMTGWHEARTKHGKDLYRLFCLHDRKASGLPGPALVLVTGGVKPSETAFPETFYRKVRALGKAYLESNPRQVLR